MAVTGYSVYVDSVLDGTTATTAYTVSGLDPATTYAIEVIAYDAAANESTPASLSVDTVDTTAPTEPGSLAANSINSTSFGITWTASTDNVGVVGYEVYLNSSLIDTVTDLFYSFSGLTPDTTYEVVVWAIDAASNVSSGANLNVDTLAAQTVLFVVADAGALGADDTNLKTKIEALGWTVTVRSDETAEGTVTQSVVVISTSVTVASLGTKYRTVAKGVLLIDRGVVDNLSFGSADGTAATAWLNMNIVNTAHPITAGFSTGNINILDETRQMTIVTKSTLGAGATTLAEQPGVSTQSMLFCYETGGSMDGGYSAPARRVFIPLHSYAEDLLVDGITLFLDRVLDWLAEYI